MASRVKLKRIYEKPAPEDGLRILVDRVWPRGVTKQAAKLDCWLKEIAPSTELRKWFSHDPAKWDEFCARYFVELDNNPINVAKLADKVNSATISLIYSAKDESRNQAVALKAYFDKIGPSQPIKP